MHGCIPSLAQTAWLPRCPGLAPRSSITSEPAGIKGLPSARDRSTMLALCPGATSQPGLHVAGSWGRAGQERALVPVQV